MILTDTEIREGVKSKDIEIVPFDDEMLQPASYDMRVGRDAAMPSASSSSTRLNLEKERILVVAPYAPAIIYTMEHLALPLDLAGRFGLKSSLSRRGIYASVGPQVDPGFQGKLSVTLLNLGASPVALNYGDAFVSLELHRLSRPASKAYSGEYQKRETFTAQELQAVLGFKGHGLGDIVHGFDELKNIVRQVGGLPEKFDAFLQSVKKENTETKEFNRALLNEMRKLVEHIVGQREQTVVLRSISRKDAKGEIRDLFRRSDGKTLFYSDVAEALSLDLELVVKLCNELEAEGHIGVLESNDTEEAEKKSS